MPVAETAPRADGWRDLRVTVADGLRLHARDYGPRRSPLLPVVCLPGLTRNSADFHALAGHLAHGRRVLALDYRGRGLSDHDADWKNYNPVAEARDCLDVMTAAGIAHAVVVGTSRGGILAMIIAALRPASLAGVVLNDIGPEIEGQGLARIKSYVERMPQPESWAEAADVVRRIFAAQFTAMGQEDWMRYARTSFAEKNGKPVLAFDRKLTRTLEGIDFEASPPKLWPQFAGLKPVPVLAIRGANSDLLSQATLERMEDEHPRLESLVVPDQGHAPFLAGDLVLGRIDAFLAKTDAALGPGKRAHPD